MDAYEIMNKAKTPAKYWAIYTAGYTALTATMTAIHTMPDGLEKALSNGIEMGLTAMIPFALTNLIYSPVTQAVTKKFGRLGANIWCGGVNLGFYYYFSKKGTSDPGFAQLVNAIVGYTLTNQHVTSIQKSE
jgi:hypothetical protein